MGAGACWLGWLGAVIPFSLGGGVAWCGGVLAFLYAVWRGVLLLGASLFFSRWRGCIPLFVLWCAGWVLLASFRSLYRSLYRYVFVPFSLFRLSFRLSQPLLSFSMTIKNVI